MAGAGYKLFNTGDVLTAAQVNTYLQEQAVMRFATTAARTTALAGVLAEGMVTYIDATDSLEFYNGSAWVAVNTTAGDITGITTGATSGLTGGVTSGTADLKLNTSAKGGLLVGTGSATSSELAVGTNGQVLTADSTTATGLKWASAGTTFSGWLAWLSPDTTGIPNATATFLGFDGEDIDTDNYHSTTTNNNRFTIPSGKAGKYLITFNVQWNGPGTATNRESGIRKNGSGVIAAPWIGGTVNGNVGFAYIVDLIVGDYIEVYTYQASGATVNIRGNNTGNGRITFCAGLYLGA